MCVRAHAHAFMFMHVCMCKCRCTLTKCMCRGQTTAWGLVITFHLVCDSLFVCAAVYAGIVVPHTSLKSVSALCLHLAIGSMGLQVHATIASCLWALGIQAQVLTLHHKYVLYPLNHLLSHGKLFFECLHDMNRLYLFIYAHICMYM